MEKKQLILIVEDETALLQAIATKIAKEGMDTVSCATAEQALDYLKNINEKPDVIWLDYYLGGGMNGLEFLEKVKANKEWEGIPILAVTNTATEDKVQKMMGLGIMKYYVKAENKLEDMVKYAKEIISNKQSNV